MTQEEVNSLQVGDLISFEDETNFDPKYFVESRTDANGVKYCIDYGLIESITPTSIDIFWFSGCSSSKFSFSEDQWESCRKAQ